MTNSNNNRALIDLEKLYKFFEKRISLLVIKEIKKQFKVHVKYRVWVTDPFIIENVNLHETFEIWIPKLVYIKQFLTALRVKQEFNSSLNIKLNINNKLNIKSVIYNIIDIFKTNKPKNKEIFKYFNNFEIKNKVYAKVSNKYPNVTSYNNRIETTSYILNKNKWNKIIDDINLNDTFNSIIHKIHTINLLYNTRTSYSSGIDNVKFWKPLSLIKSKITKYKILQKLKNKNNAELKKLQELYNDMLNFIKNQHPAHNLKNLEKKKTTLTLKRKKSLTKPEVLENLLHNTNISRKIKQLAKSEAKEMNKNPIMYVTNYNNMVNAFNTTLKFNLIKSSTKKKLKLFQSDPILRIYLPKNKDQLKSLDILTLKNKYIQKLMLLLMEPYLEPCGDNNSFGFRPGREQNHAVTNLIPLLSNKWIYSSELKKKCLSKLSLARDSKYDIIEKKRNSIKKPIKFEIENENRYHKKKNLFQFKSKILKKKQSFTKYILNANVKKFFNNVSHNWLLSNTPISSDYKQLLYSTIKVSIVEKIPTKYSLLDKTLNILWLNWKPLNIRIKKRSKYKTIVNSKTNNNGISPAGILSPILMNWTLDGLQNCTKFRTTINSNKIKTKDSNSYFTTLLLSTPLIRFATNVIFVDITQKHVIKTKKRINKFLKKRNLTLKKTKITEWSIKKKLNFLGWTFHFIYPNKRNWLTNLTKKTATKFKNQSKLYTYPSKKNTKNFKTEIKKLLSIKNSSLTPQQISKQLNSIVLSWSNYFLPSLNQRLLRSNLDYYILKRYKQWIFKKYSRKGFITAIKKLLITNKNLKPNVWNNTIKIKPKNPSVIFQIRSLKALQINISIWKIKPASKLTKLSFFIDPKAYLLRVLQLFSFKKDSEAALLIKQNFKCLYCKSDLLEWNKINPLLKEYTNDFAFLKENRTNDDSKSLKPGQQFKEYNKMFESQKILIDYILPPALTNPVLKSDTLSNNKMLIHNECYKIKKIVDEKLLLSNFLIIQKKLKKNFTFTISNKTFIELLALKLILNNDYKITTYLNYILEIYGKKHFKLNQRFITIIKKICKTKLKTFKDKKYRRA